MANFENFGSNAPDTLVVGHNVPVQVSEVIIKAGQNALKRGTVLAIATGTGGDGKCVILGSAKSGSETLTAYAILAEDVNATGDTVADAYIAGKFNRKALIVKAEHTLSADEELQLRNGGIYLTNAVQA